MNLKATVLAGVAALGVIAPVALMTTPVVAQTSDSYDYTYDDYTYDDYYYDDYYYDDYSTMSDEAATGMVIVIYALWCCGGLVGLAYSILTIISFIHCIQNAPEDQKTTWIILILLVPFAGIVYFFSKRKQWSKTTATPVSK